MKNEKKKIPTYNLTWNQIEDIKLKATHEAMDFAFRQMMLIPLMALRDHYGYGTKRLEEFIDHVADMLDSYNKGYLDLDDIENTLEEETGIKVNNGDLKRK
ncbi:hypothetical protein [Peptoniphilus sp.]|uniref:hypothetical protein n=1 Tax=Peptoniphilus sp. TaxID=1971214 RepID=UPI003D8ACF7D